MWLRLSQGDSMKALIDMNSLTTVYKHWTGSQSELCLGKACPHCKAGRPRRRCYQARVLVGEEGYDWEMSEQTMMDISRLPQGEDTNWVPVTITRTGVGRNTRVRVVSDGSTEQAKGSATPGPNPNDKYVKGRYGHMVQR
ncbi:MAG: hypothetical protein ACOC6A_03620 [Chloroflexota bacterium]